VDGRAIEWLTELALQAAASEASITPAGVTLLLRRYLATGRSDVRDALGPALGYAIDACAPSEAHAALAEWLFVFVEACTFSEDERVMAAAESLIATLRSGWPSRGDLRSSMQSVDACLSAAGRLPESDAIVPAAIDELEHIVSVVYEPGEGLSRAIDRKSAAPGDLRDHVAAVSALLTAYTITGRLPYSMLAEELMQFSRRTWWNAADGGFKTSEATSKDAMADGGPLNLGQFIANCEASRVLCRLAALHQDSEYRTVAVIARESNYTEDAKRTLEALAPSYREYGIDAVMYGLALEEWLAVGHAYDKS
jgi:hypothetical protein